MVPIIHTAESITHVLRYNEWKVGQGLACCIGAENYLSDVDNLSWSVKLRRLTDLAALNAKVNRKALHVSVNFRPGERVTAHLLQRVARSYMANIGYESQPYLVYQHFDAGHPHIHVVSTNVNEAGQRLSISPSRLKAAKEKVEYEFGFAVQGSLMRPDREAFPIKRLHYGAAPMITTVAGITDFIFGKYLFGNFEEMNALFREYGIEARRCRGNSEWGSYVVFQAINSQGRHQGVPVKGNLLPSKPTWAWLEMKYRINRVHRNAYRTRVINAIHWAFRTQPPETFEEMSQALARQSIQVLASDNPEWTSRFYVDHLAGGVFTDHLIGNLPGWDLWIQHSEKQKPSTRESWSIQPGFEPDAMDMD